MDVCTHFTVLPDFTKMGNGLQGVVGEWNPNVPIFPVFNFSDDKYTFTFFRLVANAYVAILPLFNFLDDKYT